MYVPIVYVAFTNIKGTMMHIEQTRFYKALAVSTLTFFTATISLPAAATSNFEVSASNYRYTVKDLRPDDGQAAQFLGELRSVRNNVQGSVQQGDAIIYSDAQQSLYIKNTPPSISWDGKLSGESHYAFDANENVTGQFISGALMLPADMRGELNASASTSNIFFQLAPHSEVSMSLDVVMNLYATPGSLTKGSAQVVHWARADGEELNQASVSGSVGLWNDSFTDSVDRAETLTLGFVNSSDQWMYGSFGFNLRADFSQGVVTAVPEAPAPAMLAAGIGLLGLWGRRRSRARS